MGRRRSNPPLPSESPRLVVGLWIFGPRFAAGLLPQLFRECGELVEHVALLPAAGRDARRDAPPLPGGERTDDPVPLDGTSEEVTEVGEEPAAAGVFYLLSDVLEAALHVVAFLESP